MSTKEVIIAEPISVNHIIYIHNVQPYVNRNNNSNRTLLPLYIESDYIPPPINIEEVQETTQESLNDANNDNLCKKIYNATIYTKFFWVLIVLLLAFIIIGVVEDVTIK